MTCLQSGSHFVSSVGLAEAWHLRARHTLLGDSQDEAL